jgi:RimJ/RimL family protein N-acetyltransferase
LAGRRANTAGMCRPSGAWAAFHPRLDPHGLRRGLLPAGPPALCYNGRMQPMIVVRDSAVEDLPEINRIRCHPLVRPHQFRILSHDDQRWKQWIEGNARIGDLWLRSSTIVSEEQVIGYVTQILHFADRCIVADCGWNLEPAYWGRGIMRTALQVVLDRLFIEQNTSYVIADCFRNNTRCKRLLSKLHFSQIDVPAVERISIACRFRCLHWIERYRIDRDTWDRTAGDPAS